MKNRVGMPRPKKRKIEEVEATAEDGAEIDCDTGVTGEEVSTLDKSEEVTLSLTAAVDPAAGRDGKRWQAALDAWKQVSETAIQKRVLADHLAEKEKVAQRIYDAKMLRLENGDKRKRKSSFGAARRTYEAIIALNEAQLKCAWMKCEAAEAERDAARAELRVTELE